MSYFGGLGAGKGWWKFLFLVDHDVLRDVLAASKSVLVKTNSRVPADYEGTSLEEYIAAYSRYLEAMLESVDAAKQAVMGIYANQTAMDVYIGLASSLDRFSPRPCPDAEYKLMNSDEPVVNLTPLMLYFDEKRGQLCTNAHSNLYFGLELSFPRVISLDRDKHEILYETQQYSTHRIFEDVKSRLQKMTKPCKIRSPAREHRTPIRITETMRERMRHHPGLKAAGLELV